MRHTNFIKQSSSFQLVNSSNDSMVVYRFDLVNGIQMLPNPTIVNTGDYFFTTILTEAEDYFIFVIWDSIAEIVRVGDPDILVIGYNASPGEILNYKQFSYTGSMVDEGTMTEIGYGFYYIEPLELIKSFFDIDGSLVSLVTPYKIINCTEAGGDGITGDGLFLDTGFSTYGFIGNKNSYFDLNVGAWIEDSNSIAKAADLAKAVCYKYGLEYYDKTSPLHIYNYIKYFRTYDEEEKKFRLFAAGISPENNIANFDLITEDELGNSFVKGVSMLTVQDLETIPEGSAGLILDFK